MLASTALMLSACSNVNYVDGNSEFNNPPAAIREKMKMFMPMYEGWLNQTIASHANKGRPLDADDLEAARQLGIQRPQQIRIIRAEFFPMPDSLLLSEEMERIGMGSPYEDARNMGYLIFVRPDFDTPEKRAIQLAKIHLMEKLGAARFIYRELSEMRMVPEKKDQPLNIEAERLVRCLSKNGQVSWSCKLNGNRPVNGADNSLIKFSKKDKELKGEMPATSTPNQAPTPIFTTPVVPNTNNQPINPLPKAPSAKNEGHLNFEQAIKKSAAVAPVSPIPPKKTTSQTPAERVIKVYEVEKNKK